MSDTELRWQLRQLPRELDPPRDLWPGIEARLGRAKPRRRPWLVGLAMAAGLCLAVGLSWQLQPPPAVGAEDFRAELVRREAKALTREFQAAMVQFEGAPVPAPLVPALSTLDQSAADIRLAIAADPGSVQLLDQLRRTYSRRLSLTQRAVTG
jgi:hypothetical protein